MKISDILRVKGRRRGRSTPADATVRELLASLAEHDIGALVVVDGDEVLGIVSERDVVRRLQRVGRHAARAEVSQIMTSSVVHLQLRTTTSTASPRR